MKSSLNQHVIERAQPLLGTIVTIRVEGLTVTDAHQAVGAAFERIAAIHHLMSFHEAGSDVSRLNICGHQELVTVHPWTFDVLTWALIFSSSSGGCFDVCVGAELVDWHFLPKPLGATRRPDGCWRDIELRSDGRVLFHRPLWIDLGGIAKGYAVDRASECLDSWGAATSVVNAGGDIRVSGSHPEQIALDARSETESPIEPIPMVELENGSIASSSGQRQQLRRGGLLYGPHVDGRSRNPARTDRFVSVVAEQCVVADALTKVVMAQGPQSDTVLREFGASAHVREANDEWKHLACKANWNEH